MIVTQIDGRWEFRPYRSSATKHAIGNGIIITGCIVFGALGIYGFVAQEETFALFCPGILCNLAAITGIAMAIQSWRLRDAPLIVDGTGQVLYEGNMVCAAASVHAVVLEKCWCDGYSSYSVLVRMKDGEERDLPEPYFHNHDEDERGAWAFATELAQALGVRVVESHT